MKRQILILLILSTLLLSACSGAAEAPASQAPSPEFVERAPSEPMAYEDAAEGEGTMPLSNAQVSPLAQDRKLIYNADMRLVVEDTEATAGDIEALVTGMGGYVADMSAYRAGSAELLNYNITLRVPADQFSTALEALRGMALRVENESLNTDDITDQYYDIDARLRTLRATEEELLALLQETRQRDGAVEDIMEIYRELTNIRSQIESLQGQLNRFDKLVALSTISVFLQPDELSQPLDTSWRPLETLRNAFATLIGALQGVINFLIYVLVVAVPIVLVFGIPIVLLVLLIRFLRRRRSSST